MNPLQAAIVDRALRWAACHCREVKACNCGNCIDDLTATFTGGRPWRVPYCAMTVYVIYNQACQSAGYVPLLPKSSTAIGLLTGARSLPLWFRIDNTPAPGCFFYRHSSLQGKKNGSEISGHVGIVIDWTEEKLHTVEGNASQQIRENYTSHGRMAELGCVFVHIEDALVREPVIMGPDGPIEPGIDVPDPKHCGWQSIARK